MTIVRAMLRSSAVVLALTVLVGPAAEAQDTNGPTISLNVAQARVGENLLVTIDGFESNAVTLSVCGNGARRRSADCNLPASEGQHLQRDGEPTISVLPIAPPSLPCPCVIMASTKTFDQFAMAPIEIVGHPVGPMVGPEQFEPLAVTVEAKKASRGMLASLRSSLGGPTTYAVTVTVHNPSTEPMSNITVAGAAGRSRDDDVADLTFPPIAELAPGQTWTHTVQAEVPAPVLGDVAFRVTTSGAGPAVTAEGSSSSLPVLLVILALVFLGDIGAITWRRIARRRERAMAEGDRLALEIFPRESQVVHSGSTSPS